GPPASTSRLTRVVGAFEVEADCSDSGCDSGSRLQAPGRASASDLAPHPRPPAALAPASWRPRPPPHPRPCRGAPATCSFFLEPGARSLEPLKFLGPDA